MTQRLSEKAEVIDIKDVKVIIEFSEELQVQHLKVKANGNTGRLRLI